MYSVKNMNLNNCGGPLLLSSFLYVWKPFDSLSLSLHLPSPLLCLLWGCMNKVEILSPVFHRKPLSLSRCFAFMVSKSALTFKGFLKTRLCSSVLITILLFYLGRWKHTACSLSLPHNEPSFLLHTSRHSRNNVIIFDDKVFVLTVPASVICLHCF